MGDLKIQNISFPEELKVKVLALQYAPVLMDIQASMTKVDALLEKYDAESNIDVLVLPELSFQGGFFYSKEEVLHYSEKAPLQN